jgi:hypothetical protein
MDLHFVKIGRKAAAARGIRLYFTGAQCKNGHTAARYVKTRQCTHCKSDWNEANKEGQREYKKNWHIKNQPAVLERVRIWQRQNVEQSNASKEAWLAANPEKRKSAASGWVRRNPDKSNAVTARRRSAKRLAFRPFDRELFALVESEAYALAKLREHATGIEWHVDHIVPLKSPRRQSLGADLIRKSRFVGPLLPVVQGLHNEYNLAVIIGLDNMSKSNRHWPDMP